MVNVSSFSPGSAVDIRVKPGQVTKLDLAVRLPVLGEVVMIYGKTPPPRLGPPDEHNSVVRIVTAPFRALKRLFGA